jgi:ABC transporter substrate binding protein
MSSASNPGYPECVVSCHGAGRCANSTILTAEARALGVQLHRMEVRAPGAFAGAFTAIAEGRADALLVTSDAMFGAQHQQRIVELAATHRLPSIARSPGFAEAGGLMQYGEDIFEMHRRAATYVHKILQGAKAGELPMERAMRFKLVLNLSMEGLGAAAKVNNESSYPNDERHEKQYQACDGQRPRQMRRLHCIGSDNEPMNETEEHGQERRKVDALRLKKGERCSHSLWSEPILAIRQVDEARVEEAPRTVNADQQEG